MNVKNAKDHAGKKFGKMTAIKRNGKIGDSIAWDIICDCGTEKTISAKNLTRSKSCGCLVLEKQDIGLSKRKRHGFCPRSGHVPEYGVWKAMIQRCHNPKNKHYNNYGGRGISVCDKWRKFEAFYSDMGKRPEKMTIERLNNNGDYEFSNCKWVSRYDQNRNMRNNVRKK